ncbi:MAG: hypothetical protein DMF63_03820 [Acidobacteria bacterium]|nr:MAG: hypothetical protein DMF63_03820 [Acidobacteriota bacterium]
MRNFDLESDRAVHDSCRLADVNTDLTTHWRRSMRSLNKSILIAVFFLATAGTVTGQSFTYQGKLTVNGTPTNGPYDFHFRLFDVETGGPQLGSTAALNDVTVTNGIFTVELEFGPGAITPGQKWIEMEVRPGASTGAYNLLNPRQKITPAPYSTLADRSMSSDFAEAANDSNTVGGLSPSLFIQEGDLRLTDARQPLPGSGSYVQINPGGPQSGGFDVLGNGKIGSTLSVFGATFLNSSLSVGGTISGNGSGLNNINGAGITPGTVNGTAITPGTVNGTAIAPGTFPHSENLALLGSLRWDLLSPKSFTVTTPGGIAFDGTNIWVANGGNNTVTKLRASDGVVLGVFPINGNATNVVFDGGNIWVTSSSAGTVIKLRASDGALLGTFPVVNPPTVMAFDGENIWVASVSPSLRKLRASDGALLGTFPVGLNPRAIAFDGANIWTTNINNDSVTKLRASDGAVLDTFAVSGRPAALAFDGANIWVGKQGNGVEGPSIIKLRASDGAAQALYPIGFAPFGMVFDGSNIWVTGGGGVLKLQGSDGTHLGTFSPATSSFGIGFDGANIWLSNGSGANTITKVPAFP